MVRRAVHQVMIADQAGVEVAKVIKVDDLRIPIHIALGRLEAASESELDELLADLTHERNRRLS